MQPRSLSRAWKTAPWIRRLSGLSCSPSTADAGVTAWMSSLPVSPASPGARQVKVKAPRTTDGSGQPSKRLLATFDPGSCSWKTSRPSLFEADSPSSSLTLPLSVSMRSQRLYEQPTSALRINGSASSSWPTAAASDSRSSGRHTTETGVMHPGTSLTDAMRGMWRTPDAPHGGGVRNRQASRGRGHQLTIAEQAEHWATPTAMDSEQAGGKGATGTTRGQSLHRQVADDWPTPLASDSEQRGHTGSPKMGRVLKDVARECWPTPTAEPYGSSQNGINGKGGEFERPSAATPSLERMSHSFLPDLPTWALGAGSSAPDLSSPQLWKTPHGIANMDASGKVAGGGGEFAKQVMQNPETWSTPRAQCNIQNKKNFGPPSEGGRSSKPGLEDQAHAMRERWPSPTVMDSAGFHGEPDTGRTSPNSGKTLAGVTEGSARKAKLNPQFVEWLMGLPIGWTAFAPVAMASYRSRQRAHLSYLLGELE